MASRSEFLGLFPLLSSPAERGAAPAAHEAANLSGSGLRARFALPERARALLVALRSTMRAASEVFGRGARAALSAFLADRYAVVVLCLAVVAGGVHHWAETFWWGGSDHLDNLLMTRGVAL